MSKNDQIFLNQPENDNQKTPEDIKYIHNTQSADYISQFLLQQASNQLSKDKHESAPIHLEQIRQINEEEEQKKQQTNGSKKRVKSLFHNFQKHLVISLKNIVKIKPPQHDDLIPRIAYDMWSIFLKSHLYTKTILHILYGAQCEQQQCSFTSSMLNRFGYVDLFNKYSEDLVKEAQQYLRKQTIKEFEKINIKGYLTRRRMAKSEEFQDYLDEFIEELKQGPIKRRIPKTKKKNLKAYQKSIHPVQAKSKTAQDKQFQLPNEGSSFSEQIDQQPSNNNHRREIEHEKRQNSQNLRQKNQPKKPKREADSQEENSSLQIFN